MILKRHREMLWQLGSRLPTMLVKLFTQSSLAVFSIGNRLFSEKRRTCILAPKGLIEILTIKSPQDFVRYGIPYIMTQVIGSEEKYAAFWEYFLKQWCRSTCILEWNVHLFGANIESTIINRSTNMKQTILGSQHWNQ